jgi:hypothetical protein
MKCLSGRAERSVRPVTRPAGTAAVSGNRCTFLLPQKSCTTPDFPVQSRPRFSIVKGVQALKELHYRHRETNAPCKT